MLSKLSNWLRPHSEPRLQAAYLVFHEDQAIASLESPSIEDQFWVSFTLRPLITSPELLALLYNDDSWSNQALTIQEAESKQPVLFLLALDWEETEDEVTARSVLQHKPERILLRGPYRCDVLPA